MSTKDPAKSAASTPPKSAASTPPGHGGPPAWLALIKRNIFPLVFSIFLAGGIHLFFGYNNYAFANKLFLDIAIAIVLAVSLNMVNGYTGQFSMGHAGFMAIGGYFAAALTFYGSIRLFGSPDAAGGVLSWAFEINRMPEGTPLLAKGDLLFLASCLLGGLVAALAGYLVGLPSLRLRGDYLAIVTLGFGEIVRVLLQATRPQIMRAADVKAAPVHELPLHLGQALGFNRIPAYTTLFWAYLIVCITVIIAYRLKYSTSGRAMLSIREDEVAAEAMGINTTKYKVRAFVLASFFAGVAGALFAHQIGSINAGELGFIKSFDVIIIIVLGGLGSISGAVLAAAVLTVLPELLRDPPTVLSLPGAIVVLATVGAVAAFSARRRRAVLVTLGVFAGWEIVRRLAGVANIDLADYRMIAYALMLILIMIVRPQGLFGIHEVWEFGPMRRVWARIRGAKRGEVAS